MTNMIEDVSKLTNIPEKLLQKLLKKCMYSILQTVYEDSLVEKTISEINVGLGALYIKHEKKDDLKFKFVPCVGFSKEISSTVGSEKSPLDACLSINLEKKLLEAYKDLC